jgi:hypothetical protein
LPESNGRSQKIAPSPKPKRYEGYESADHGRPPRSRSAKKRSPVANSWQGDDESENLETDQDEMTPVKNALIDTKIISNPFEQSGRASSGLVQRDLGFNTWSGSKVQPENHDVSRLTEVEKLRLEVHRLNQDNQRLNQQRMVIVSHYEDEIKDLRDKF